MVPEPVNHTRQKRVRFHAERYLSCDRDAACGTLYVTVPITWLRISSTRFETPRSLVLVVSSPRELSELQEPEEPQEFEAPVSPRSARAAQPAGAVDVEHVRPVHAPGAQPAGAADVGG